MVQIKEKVENECGFVPLALYLKECSEEKVANIFLLAHWGLLPKPNTTVKPRLSPSLL